MGRRGRPGRSLASGWVTEPDLDTPLSRTAASAAVADIGWRYLLGTLAVSVPVRSLAQASEVAATAVAASGKDSDGHLRVDMRPDRVSTSRWPTTRPSPGCAPPSPPAAGLPMILSPGLSGSWRIQKVTRYASAPGPTATSGSNRAAAVLPGSKPAQLHDSGTFPPGRGRVSMLLAGVSAEMHAGMGGYCGQGGTSRRSWTSAHGGSRGSPCPGIMTRTWRTGVGDGVGGPRRERRRGHHAHRSGQRVHRGDLPQGLRVVWGSASRWAGPGRRWTTPPSSRSTPRSNSSCSPGSTSRPGPARGSGWPPG